MNSTIVHKIQTILQKRIVVTAVQEPGVANVFVAFCATGTGQGEVLEAHRINGKEL